MGRLAWTGKGCGGVGRGLGDEELGDRGLSLMVSVLRLSPPPLVTDLSTVGEEKGRWSPIHPTPSQHHHRLQAKEPRLDSLSSCVIWVSQPCFFLTSLCICFFTQDNVINIYHTGLWGAQIVWKVSGTQQGHTKKKLLFIWDELQGSSSCVYGKGTGCDLTGDWHHTVDGQAWYSIEEGQQN